MIKQRSNPINSFQLVIFGRNKHFAFDSNVHHMTSNCMHFKNRVFQLSGIAHGRRHLKRHDWNINLITSSNIIIIIIIINRLFETSHHHTKPGHNISGYFIKYVMFISTHFYGACPIKPQNVTLSGKHNLMLLIGTQFKRTSLYMKARARWTDEQTQITRWKYPSDIFICGNATLYVWWKM